MYYYTGKNNRKFTENTTSIWSVLLYVKMHDSCNRTEWAKTCGFENNHIGNSAWTWLVYNGYIERFNRICYRITENGRNILETKMKNFVG